MHLLAHCQHFSPRSSSLPELMQIPRKGFNAPCVSTVPKSPPWHWAPCVSLLINRGASLLGKAGFPPNFAAGCCVLCRGTGPCFPVFWRCQGHARSPLALVLGGLWGQMHPLVVGSLDRGRGDCPAQIGGAFSLKPTDDRLGSRKGRGGGLGGCQSSVALREEPKELPRKPCSFTAVSPSPEVLRLPARSFGSPARGSKTIQGWTWPFSAFREKSRLSLHLVFK